MISLRPFWRYYGGKWRAAPRYPKPLHDTIVEPFAGAAGYALRYPERKVVLVEKYPVVAEIWRYLIGVDAAEVRAIPLTDSVDDLPSWVPQAARWLVGFAMNSATAAPRRTLSAGLRRQRLSGRPQGGWSEVQRDRVASQLDAIRHWRVVEGDYATAPDIKATWFIDPPYQRAGIHYTCPSTAIDFAALGAWCRSRPGQVIACEASGATWLPFRDFGVTKASNMNATTAGVSHEVIWTSGDGSMAEIDARRAA